MMATKAKGTVTSLSSIFPVEEAMKAQERVAGAIEDRNKDLDSLFQFAAQNASLINLVKRLPDELSHDIMVPFSKAAFFPGRLIHTNEFLVLLGDGYYAERTSKQTLDILHRRGKSLENQINTLKAVISDLQAEASFFNATATEASEGLVDIQEDYVEESPTEATSESSNCSNLKNEPSGPKDIVNDEEYSRIMSLLDELEKEEQNITESDMDDEEETNTTQTKEEEMWLMNSVHAQTARTPIEPAAVRNNEISGMEASKPPVSERGESSCDQEHKAKPVLPDNSPNATGSIKNYIMTKVENANISEHSPQKSVSIVWEPENKDIGHRSVTEPFSEKSFVGSIVEREQGISSTATNANSSQNVAPNPAKPVSRFKLQKSGRL